MQRLLEGSIGFEFNNNSNNEQFGEQWEDIENQMKKILQKKSTNQPPKLPITSSISQRRNIKSLPKVKTSPTKALRVQTCRSKVGGTELSFVSKQWTKGELLIQKQSNQKENLDFENDFGHPNSIPKLQDHLIDTQRNDKQSAENFLQTVRGSEKSFKNVKSKLNVSERYSNQLFNVKQQDYEQNVLQPQGLIKVDTTKKQKLRRKSSITENMDEVITENKHNNEQISWTKKQPLINICEKISQNHDLILEKASESDRLKHSPLESIENIEKSDKSKKSSRDQTKPIQTKLINSLRLPIMQQRYPKIQAELNRRKREEESLKKKSYSHSNQYKADLQQLKHELIEMKNSNFVEKNAIRRASVTKKLKQTDNLPRDKVKTQYCKHSSQQSQKIDENFNPDKELNLIIRKRMKKIDKTTISRESGRLESIQKCQNTPRKVKLSSLLQNSSQLTQNAELNLLKVDSSRRKSQTSMFNQASKKQRLELTDVSDRTKPQSIFRLEISEKIKAKISLKKNQASKSREPQTDGETTVEQPWANNCLNQKNTSSSLYEPLLFAKIDQNQEREKYKEKMLHEHQQMRKLLFGNRSKSSCILNEIIENHSEKKAKVKRKSASVQKSERSNILLDVKAVDIESRVKEKRLYEAKKILKQNIDPHYNKAIKAKKEENLKDRLKLYRK